jgi:hypothetical protein
MRNPDDLTKAAEKFAESVDDVGYENADKKHRVKQSDLWSTTQTINRIHNQLNSGYIADKAQLTLMVDAMLRFLHDTIKEAPSDSEV